MNYKKNIYCAHESLNAHGWNETSTMNVYSHRWRVCSVAHTSRKNGFLLTGLRAISSALSASSFPHTSSYFRGPLVERHEFRRFDAVHLRSWLPIDRRCSCQTGSLPSPTLGMPASPRWRTFHELFIREAVRFRFIVPTKAIRKPTIFPKFQHNRNVLFKQRGKKSLKG